MKQIIKDFKDGEPLTDAELDSLITHYQSLCDLLDPHGDIFRLVWRECFDSLHILEGFKNARNRKK